MYQQFSLKGIQSFIVVCIIFWIGATVALIHYGSHPLFQEINQSYSETKDAIVPWITRIGELWVILPLLLSVLLIKEYRNKRFFYSLALSQLVPFAITHILKQLFRAPRPMHYFEDASWFHYVVGQPKQYKFSFPSGHTEASFAMFVFIALILPKRYAWMGVLLALTGVCVGLSRVYLSQHFIEDILAGSLIGTIFCMLTFFIYPPVSQKHS